MTYQAVVITPNGVWFDNGKHYEVTPAGLLYDIEYQLRQCAVMFDRREGVVLLDGIDLRHPAIAEGAARAREAGWTSFPSAAEIGPWTTWRREGKPVIHIGIRRGMLDNPLLKREFTPEQCARLLGSFHQLTGTSWRVTAGVVGVALLRARYRDKRAGKQPRWRGSGAPMGMEGAGALLWHRQPTDVERQRCGWVHQYDATGAYLSAAASVDLPWGELEHTGARSYERGVGGYWQIAAPPALFSRFVDIPAPVDPADAQRGRGTAWVTSPIMSLFEDFGMHPEVLDSWTCGDTRRITRAWAAELGHARERADRWYRYSGHTDEGHCLHCALVKAVKAVGNETIGLIGREGGTVYRRDWYDSIVDCARATLLRKIYAAAKQDRRPLRVRVDAVWYASRFERAEEGSPFPLGAKLGQFHLPRQNGTIAMQRYGLGLGRAVVGR